MRFLGFRWKTDRNLRCLFIDVRSLVLGWRHKFCVERPIILGTSEPVTIDNTEFVYTSIDIRRSSWSIIQEPLPCLNRFSLSSSPRVRAQIPGSKPEILRIFWQPRLVNSCLSSASNPPTYNETCYLALGNLFRAIIIIQLLSHPEHKDLSLPQVSPTI